MGPSPLLSCWLWAAVVCVAAAQTPMYLIAAPRLLHLGVRENVWIQMEWPQGTKPPSGDVKVEIYLRNQRTMKPCSPVSTVILNSGNNYIYKGNVELTPAFASACKLEENRINRYVQLVATSSLLRSDRQVVSIPVSYKRGYIFIQTDKSVYTPQETVNFRLFTLDHMMRPTKEPVVSTVTNAEGLQVQKFVKTTETSVIPGDLKIPDISTTGVWRISAHFSTAPESNFTAEFEVKKYVLPNFEVKIIPELPYFLITKKDFTIKVEARYVYGEPVDGSAYVRIGIIDPQGKKTLLQGLEQQVKMKKGEGTVQISKDGILKKVNLPAQDLVGSIFYIAASVMEKASGNLEEKEISNVKFVTSPYSLDLSKTKRYFTPGTPTAIVAEVTLSDGSPARGVTVTLLNSNTQILTLTTNEDGMVEFKMNTNEKDRSLDLTVRVVGNDGRQEEKLNLTPYSSASNSFLHMDIPTQVLYPGETLKLSLKVVSPNAGRVRKIYHMILSKGQILSLKSTERTEFTVVDILIENNMIPSFRIIAYYYTGSELVANSVWVDVADVCEGELHIKTNVDDSVQPGSTMRITVDGHEGTTVYLSGVDTAVYLVNAKNKLTPGKVFKAMNDYDLGCSPGGGRDDKAVFMDAGVAYVSSASVSDYKGAGCQTSQRKKRAIDFPGLTRQKANRYSSEHLRKCCTNGMMLLPARMDKDCHKRARRVENSDCRNAFLDCCKYAEELRKQISIEKRKQHNIARTQTEEEDEEFTDENEVQIRSKFEETWLWTKKVTLGRRGSETLTVPTPDSITTWEIQAVGMSPKQGFCVATPVNLKVFKKFHIHLKVPYSIKRFEQIELRPVLHNYMEQDLKVKVFVDKSEGICSPKTSDGNVVEQIVTVPAYSALAIPFSVVPIKRSAVTVTVKALGPYGISDAVQKVLRVQQEGVSVTEAKSYVVDPEDQRRNEITIDDELPSNMIPDSDYRSSVRIILDSPIDTINNTLSPDGVSRLIRVPYGCAEQTMISTAPGIYALHYLDHTDKWISLPPNLKDEGLKNMQRGYERILSYRKQDGSYGAWLNRPSSTWLTAFVVKVMSLCRNHIPVDVEELRKSAHYLTSKQTGTGAFQETMQVIHQDMTGGVKGKNVEVSLTAYVLIALHHSQPALAEDDTKVKASISKAIDYLRKALDSLSDSYPLAITAYALNLVSGDSVLKDKAYMLLTSTGQDVPDRGELYFGPKDTAQAVETTSYVLLAALLRNDMASAHKMYTWLSEQRNYGGGFKSTQDTVMALEALSEYWIKTFTSDRKELQVVINSLERSHSQRFTLRNDDSVQEELRSMGLKFKVKVSGKGSGILTVLKMYNILNVDNSNCLLLGLEVEVLGEEKVTDDYTYNYNDYYDGEEGEAMSDEPLQSIHWHDLRSRARREVSQPKEKQVTLTYRACMWTKAIGQESGMVIVDITMLSGFEASTQDLNKLKESSERYISHYEIHGGRVLLYIDKVTNEQTCVSFEAVQTVKISPLQPASAVFYDFYEPDNQCRVFYSAPSRSSFISTLCSEDVCQCAEGPCPKMKRTVNVGKDERQTFACYSPRVMYGFHVTVTSVTQEDAFMVYSVKIVNVLQTNGDEKIQAGHTRLFYEQAACKMRLEEKKVYLIMGQDGETKDQDGRMRYFLNDKSWVEELATEQACRATRLRNQCADMKKFMEDYQNNGCKV